MRRSPSPRGLRNGLDDQGRSRILAARRFGRRFLGDLKRRSGESYAVHGEEMASVLRELSADASLLCVAILHDVLMHPDGQRLLADAALTARERLLVQKMHPLRRLQIDANTEELDRVISAFMQDPELLPLRMAHRLNDVRHLDRFPAALRRQIAGESLHMYTAIAGRLGMHAWRHEMEDTCFPIVNPQAAVHLRAQFAASEELDDACLRQSRSLLLRALRTRGIPCRIETRRKNLYSTYRKMVIKRRRFHELTDRLAVRILVESEEDCYRSLGIVHAHMHPIPGKLKDYIGAPKENGYRSIHTVVYPLAGVSEQPIEIQIRTHAMHWECEYGVAAHGEYKGVVYAMAAQPTRVNLFRNLEILRQEARSPEQFERVLRTYFNEDHIAVFDHRNNLYHVKKPATALDFLCLIHPKRVSRLRSVRINGREQAAGTPLHDGDTVEPAFGTRVALQREWIHAVAHAVSRRHLSEALHRNTGVLLKERHRPRERT